MVTLPDSSDDTDWVLALQRDPAWPTIIAFSSVNTPRGRFKPYKIYDGVAANILMVNTDRNDWYQSGIPGVHSDANDAALALVARARSMGSGRVVTFGTSMGAAGAMLYAALGGADACLAFGVEAELGIEGSRSAMHDRSGRRPRWKNIAGVLEASRVPMYLYAAENDEWDLFGAWTLRECSNVTCVSVRGTEHPGLQVFDLDGTLPNLLAAFASQLRPIVGFARQGSLFANWTLIEGLTHAGQLRRQGNSRAWLDSMRDLRQRFPGQPLVWQRLGDALQLNRDGPNSERCWRTAIEMCPFQYEAHGKLTNLHRKRGELDRALEHARAALAIYPRSAHLHHNLGLVLTAVQQPHAAEEAFRRALEIGPGNKNFQMSLAQCLGTERGSAGSS